MGRVNMKLAAMLLGVVSLGPMVEAAAQTGSILSRRGAAKVSELKDNKQRFREVMQQYGDCLADQQPAGTRKMLRLNLVRFAKTSMVGTESCLSGGMLRYSMEAFRGALAEGAYRVAVRKGKAPALAKQPYDVGSIVMDSHWNRDTMVALLEATQCAVRADFATADKLMRADVNTQAEREAFKGFGNVLAGCIPPQVKISFDPVTLRGAVAEIMFRTVIDA